MAELESEPRATTLSDGESVAPAEMPAATAASVHEPTVRCTLFYSSDASIVVCTWPAVPAYMEGNMQTFDTSNQACGFGR